MLHPDSELLAPPDLRAMLIGYIDSSLAALSTPITDNVNVSGSVPDGVTRDNPQKVITVFVPGGTGKVDTFIYSAIVQLDTYAATESDAFDLAAIVSALIDLAPISVPGIMMIDNLSALIPFTDDDGSPRVFQSFTVFANPVKII